MALHAPDPVQAAMWSRTMRRWGRFADKLGDDDQRKMTEQEKTEFIKLADRFANIILGVLADEQDQDWIEDSVLAGDIDNADVLDLLHQIGEQLGMHASADGAKAARVE